MLLYIARRLLYMVITLVVVSVVALAALGIYTLMRRDK